MIRSVCKCIFCVSLIWFSGFEVVAQQERIDSLKRALLNATPIDSFNTYVELSVVYANELSNYRVALNYTTLANGIAFDLGDSSRIVQSGRMMGQVYRLLNKTDSQLYIIQKMLPIAERNNFLREQGKLCNTMGLALAVKAEYDKAMKIFFESYQIHEQLGDQETLGRVLSNIGWVYYKLSNYNKALEFYSKGMDIGKTVGDQRNEIVLTTNISLCLAHLGKMREAKSYIDRFNFLCKNNCTSEDVLSQEFALGIYFFLTDSLSFAESHFLSGYQLAKDQENTRFVFDCTFYLSKIFIKKGEIGKAHRYLQEAELLGRASGNNKELIELYSQLSAVYGKRKDYVKMAHYQEKYIQLKDSVFGDQKRNNLMRVNAEFLERENRAKIESQAESIKLQDELIARQKQIRILILVVAGLMMVLVYILYRINLQRKAANFLLDQMVAERTRELEKSYQELRSAIHERDAVAKKIFDEVKSSLATVGGLCIVGKKDFENGAAGKYLDAINETSLKIRDSINGLG